MMKFQFDNSDLSDLYYAGKGKELYPEYVVTAFYKRMQLIRNAVNLNDLKSINGNKFEKLRGEDNKYSIRLNDQFRLIFHLGSDGSCVVLIISEISNHYS